jgi:hypothetical protein
MVERVEAAPGKFETRTATVTVRKPAIGTVGTTSEHAGIGCGTRAVGA